jgi:hypothetical protein
MSGLRGVFHPPTAVLPGSSTSPLGRGMTRAKGDGMTQAAPVALTDRNRRVLVLTTPLIYAAVGWGRAAMARGWPGD